MKHPSKFFRGYGHENQPEESSSSGGATSRGYSVRSAPTRAFRQRPVQNGAWKHREYQMSTMWRCTRQELSIIWEIVHEMSQTKSFCNCL